ncbi:MAG TPA: hypothetical protein VJR23_02525 [Candidatus Acidoferrales bacterium]|nr:hypothetical protein [Candidatus Acidoferrales bacterium]
MKYRLLTVLALVAVVFALSFIVSVPASPAAPALPATLMAPSAPATATATPAPEPHPEIREAIASLKRARAHLEHGAHDFGGHRVDAIKATDEAIHQLQLCLEFDK